MPARRRYLLRRAPLITLPRPVMQALTFLFWTVSLALFRADSVAAAFQMIRNLFTRWWLPGYLFLTGEQFQPVELYAVHKGLSLFAPSLLRPYSTVLWILMLALCSYLVFFRMPSGWPDTVPSPGGMLSSRASCSAGPCSRSPASAHSCTLTFNRFQIRAISEGSLCSASAVQNRSCSAAASGRPCCSIFNISPRQAPN